MQHNATHCNVLQHTATHCNSNTLQQQHTATAPAHWSKCTERNVDPTLQHAATHCNSPSTLQQVHAHIHAQHRYIFNTSIDTQPVFTSMSEPAPSSKRRLFYSALALLQCSHSFTVLLLFYIALTLLHHSHSSTVLFPHACVTFDIHMYLFDRCRVATIS